MPYIKQEDRDILASLDGPLSYSVTPGELNYEITLLLDEYIRNNGLKYQKINDCLGALEGAKLEFYRRVAVPYEEIKLCENGDVYSEHTLGKVRTETCNEEENEKSPTI